MKYCVFLSLLPFMFYACGFGKNDTKTKPNTKTSTITSTKTSTTAHECEDENDCGHWQICDTEFQCVETLEAPGTLLGKCLKDTLCDVGFVCNQNKICVKKMKNDQPDTPSSQNGTIGNPCNDGECDFGLACNLNDICVQDPNIGRKGFSCKSDLTCNGALRCDEQKICRDPAQFSCPNQQTRNECGGCEALIHAIGISCGVCGNGSYQCSKTSSTTVCIDPDENKDNKECPAMMIKVPWPSEKGESYFIDSTEVTRQQYDVFLQSNPSAQTNSECLLNTSYTPKNEWPFDVNQANLPVVHIDWCDAKAYCEFVGKHLCKGDFDMAANPVISEWENACSEGGKRLYPYGGISYQAQKCNDESYQDPDLMAEVGTMTSCEGGFAGIFDMAGNVHEWTDECKDGNCLVRGGSYTDAGNTFGACNTINHSPRELTNHNIGFRCCK